jgi:hypothetical protein
MKGSASVAFAGLTGTLLALGAVASCGSRTGVLLGEVADAAPEQGIIRPDHSTEEPKAEDVVEEIPGIDTNRSDVPIINLCSDTAATVVYVIGKSGNLYVFNPATQPPVFGLVGLISCPGSLGRPFSMAVDRKGVAYVAYSEGSSMSEAQFGTGIYRVNTRTRDCKPTSYDAAKYGNVTFGMGFVADVSNRAAGDETLYISQNAFPNGKLGTIDTTTFELNYVAPYNAAVALAQLTGTGDGRLFAFQPLVTQGSESTTESFIAQIDPATANVIDTEPLPGLVAGDGWAFAFWGGKFYVFTAPSGSTIVTQFDPSTKTSVAVSDSSDVILAACVSTCAPLS